MHRHSSILYSVGLILLTCFLYTCQRDLQEQVSKELKAPNDLASKPPIPILAATRATSPLLKGLLQQVREGEKINFQVSYNVDLAHLALHDGVIMAAMSSKRDELSDHLLVAESTLSWAGRYTRSMTEKQWHDFIEGKALLWSKDIPFQLCFRQEPDPLEELWVTSRPQDKPLLQAARQSGRWPIFENDQLLMNYLSTHKGAIGLFVEANLKVKASPVSILKIHQQPSIPYQAYLSFYSMKNSYEIIQRLFELVKSPDRSRAVQEWGWLR